MSGYKCGGLARNSTTTFETPGSIAPQSRQKGVVEPVVRLLTFSVWGMQLE
jgi:hypothetical protein